MNRLDRLLGYLLLLQSRDLVRAQDLAAQFEVSERTVYRDMDALAEIGVPVVGQAGEGYRLMAGYTLPPIMFSETEAQALFLAVAMLSGLTSPGPTQIAAATALAKVRAVLPKATLAQVEALRTVLGFYSVSRSRLNLDDEKFLQLQQAINQHHVVYIHYHAQHSNRITAREIEPLYLAYVDNIWLVQGYCRLRQDLRNFRLDRIDQLTVRTEIFVPHSMNMKRFLDDGARVVVRFEGDIVRWVREAQHFGFREEEPEADDGSVVMVYQVSEVGQIMRWLLGWGDGMEVLEPLELRAAVAETAARMATQHVPTVQAQLASPA
ncbi:MAG: YafY family protein [Chloroflexi bacterium]|nr:YafY family protein [Chloroflexota bacterium]